MRTQVGAAIELPWLAGQAGAAALAAHLWQMAVQFAYYWFWRQRCLSPSLPTKKKVTFFDYHRYYLNIVCSNCGYRAGRSTEAFCIHLAPAYKFNIFTKTLCGVMLQTLWWAGVHTPHTHAHDTNNKFPLSHGADECERRVVAAGQAGNGKSW